MLRVTICICTSFLIFNTSIAQVALADSIITRKKLQDIVYELADDSLKGRYWNSEGAVEAAAFIAKRMNETGLKKMSGMNGYYDDFIFKIGKDSQTITMRNVIGVLPGMSQKDELVIFSAHYDHIGLVSNNHPLARIFSKKNADTIYNGANDDASGIAALLSLAEYFTAKGRQEKTILFVAFSAEEAGMYGSEWLTQGMDASLITANINLEMLGRKSESGSKPFITGNRFSDLQKLLNDCLKKTTGEKGYFVDDPVPKQNLFSRSDNIAFARQGVPAHTIMLTTSTDRYYHDVKDEAATLDYELMTKIVRNVALASECLVNGSSTPTRINKNFDFNTSRY